MSHKKDSKRSKEVKKVLSTLKAGRLGVEEALEIVKKIPKVKFDEAIEIAVHLGIDTKQADQQIRTTVSLPAGTGKKVRVAVIAEGEDAKACKDAGADIVGYQELIKDIEEGKINFDKLLTSPKSMKDLGKLGRVLGPKGLMPNPKDGTVTNDLPKTVEEIKKGTKVNVRAEKDGGVIHMLVGRRSFSNQDLLTNIKEALSTLNRIKPSTAKGTYFKSAFIKSTMGPAIEFDALKAAA